MIVGRFPTSTSGRAESIRAADPLICFSITSFELSLATAAMDLLWSRAKPPLLQGRMTTRDRDQPLTSIHLS